MKKASPFTFLQLKKKEQVEKQCNFQKQDLDLNIFVVTFSGMKQAQSNISGGDPYTCVKCKAILNKFSVVVSAKDAGQKQNKYMVELKNNESLWECQFCGYPNVIKIDKEEIPTKDDIVYLVQSDLQKQSSTNESTIVFCIDASGSMNTTTEVEGKIDLKFGISQQQMQMLKQFMEPGDQLQYTFLPGNHNKNKTFISRKQCILSAIESQLKEIKKSDPLKRVGFVTFNSEVTVIGDNKTPTINIVGDKLSNRQAIVDNLAPFKLQQPINTSYEGLIKQLEKQEAKGQTALGPALVSAIEVASKGSPGSTVILCTDGLANVGIGYLDPLTEENRKFYEELGILAKQRNISVSIVTIKGQGSKMEVIGKLAELTNGNMKVVNPEKLSEDFANVLKDQVVGVNVDVTIQLHKAMNFRNEDKQNLFENKTILKRKFANATTNTKVSFEYELRCQEDLKFMEVDINQLKKVPFQTQILYTSPRGGKFLRVVSSQTQTTTDKKQSIKNVNIGVAHQRVAAITTNLYSKGDHIESVTRNQVWSDYLADNFQQEKYQAKQMAFQQKNAKLNKAIEHKSQKLYKEDKKVVKEEKKKEKSKIEEEREDEMNRSLVDSDEDQAELMENLMEKRSYNMSDQQQK